MSRVLRGVGCDVVSISRVRRLVERHGDRFLERAFAADEARAHSGAPASLAAPTVGASS